MKTAGSVACCRALPHLPARWVAPGGIVTAALAAGCARAVSGPPLPPAEAYPVPSDFSGQWIGEIAGTPGVLAIEKLGTGRYYGTFTPDDEALNAYRAAGVALG